MPLPLSGGCRRGCRRGAEELRAGRVGALGGALRGQRRVAQGRGGQRRRRLGGGRRHGGHGGGGGGHGRGRRPGGLVDARHLRQQKHLWFRTVETNPRFGEC